MPLTLWTSDQIIEGKFSYSITSSISHLHKSERRMPLSNLLRGFVSCFAFMLVDKGWMTILYNGRSKKLHHDLAYSLLCNLTFPLFHTLTCSLWLVQEPYSGKKNSFEEKSERYFLDWQIIFILLQTKPEVADIQWIVAIWKMEDYKYKL